ncbi:MaoC/PaaZ C-terminal domain-containing protein [Caldinitratiruptor microaerophilus]|uniref:MaoC family dehydratase n=1 Tax=Caldinitratiruptor microaerophilus TaxID=671077 RepID=A0AA35CLM6_9FIRM|nr:MaoC/PaaZ C-terminal domain-containing protein [Caldinitratiruptor microaerophilus]BDG59576.1 MaoC family dehydratase [Caldinitratiruptor microaerophilus]
MQPGHTFPPLVKEPVTQMQLVRYAGASGDFNPVHTVEAVGRAAGFGGPIAHGMLVMGFAAQAVASWVPLRSVRRLQVRFVDVTRPGDALTVEGTVTGRRAEAGEDRITAELVIRDQEGRVKAKGSFEAALPVQASRGA